MSRAPQPRCGAVGTRGDSPGRRVRQIMLTRRNGRGEPGPSSGGGEDEEASEGLYREHDEEWEDKELGRDEVDETQPYKVHIVYRHEIIASGVQTVADAGVAYGLTLGMQNEGFQEHVLRSLRAVWSPLTGVSHEARIAECVLQGDATGPSHGSSSRLILPRACQSFPRHGTADTRFDLHDGVGWNLVFRQMTDGSLLQKGEWQHGTRADRDNPKATYSRLHELEDYRNADGKFTLALVMQGAVATQPFTNVWRQASNPVGSSSASSPSTASCTGAFECARAHSDEEQSSPEHSVLGYQALSVEDDSFGWGGLRRSSSPGALLDGSVDLDRMSRQCAARARPGSASTGRPIIGYLLRPSCPLTSGLVHSSPRAAAQPCRARRRTLAARGWRALERSHTLVACTRTMVSAGWTVMARSLRRRQEACAPGASTGPMAAPAAFSALVRRDCRRKNTSRWWSLWWVPQGKALKSASPRRRGKCGCTPAVTTVLWSAASLCAGATRE